LPGRMETWVLVDRQIADRSSTGLSPATGNGWTTIFRGRRGGGTADAWVDSGGPGRNWGKFERHFLVGFTSATFPPRSLDGNHRHSNRPSKIVLARRLGPRNGPASGSGPAAPAVRPFCHARVWFFPDKFNAHTAAPTSSGGSITISFCSVSRFSAVSWQARGIAR